VRDGSDLTGAVHGGRGEERGADERAHESHRDRPDTCDLAQLPANEVAAQQRRVVDPHDRGSA
jgi:hypothetical protein